MSNISRVEYIALQLTFPDAWCKKTNIDMTIDEWLQTKKAKGFSLINFAQTWSLPLSSSFSGDVTKCQKDYYNCEKPSRSDATSSIIK